MIRTRLRGLFAPLALLLATPALPQSSQPTRVITGTRVIQRGGPLIAPGSASAPAVRVSPALQAAITVPGAPTGQAAQATQAAPSADPGRTIVVDGQRIAIPDEVSDEEVAGLIEKLRAQGLEVSDMETGIALDEDEKPVDPQFMQLMQQAQLDRRPSTILAEWSKPEPVAPDEDPELAEPEAPEPIGDAPTAPTAPKAPERPADLVEPTAPADVVAPVSSIADVLALSAKKAEAADGYAEAKAAYDKRLAAYEAEVAAHEAALEAHAEAQKVFALANAAYAAKKKKFDKANAAYNQAKAKNQMARTQRKVEIFRRNVTLGRWDAVAETLAEFGEKGAPMQYQQLLMKIARSPQQIGGSLAQYQEQPAFEFDDIVALIRIAPGGFSDDKAGMITPLVARVFEQGHSLDDWLVRLRAEIARPEDERVISQRLAALLLAAQRKDLELGEFLPTMEDMVEANDREGLNLLARHRVAEHAETPSPETLGQAWEATLAVLAPGEVDDKQKTEALRRAVDLASGVRDEKGEAWLHETFAERPERGMEVLATIGAKASQGMTSSSGNPTARLEDLKLLHSAVVALLEIAPERAEEWRETLTLVADMWLREAEHSFEHGQQTTLGPQYQRDAYGNIYWYDNYSYRYNRVPVSPIEPGELLEVRPDGAWRGALPASLRPKIDQTIAELYLKVQEEELAFPYIADLAPANPKKANELAKTFLEVWLNNNDPNNSRNRSSVYNFSYGFNQRAAGIPLTRSRQDRNLRELAKWVGELRDVDGIEVDSELVMRCFRQVHSQAEVYRVEVLEDVFGDLENLEPETLASMTQQMRANLGQLWRIPAVQRDAKTNRKQKEIEAEVQRGYTVAQRLLERALRAHPDSWRLRVVRGAMLHDLNNYANQIQKSSDFSGKRREALDVLRDAALAYVDEIPNLRTDEYTIDAFTTWFYAALGASDIGAVDQSTLLAKDEIGALRAVLDGIEGEAGEDHRARFANQVFTRLSSVNPAVKDRYLKAGFDIVGDHPQAREARRVYEYYQDLVTEIELVTTVDGSTDVGTEPFGLFVDLRYTKEIGRESGGFGKYLQNQANAVNRYYNYGKPQENYRDKFEESARTLLSEQFDVLSVTFNRENAATKMDPGPTARPAGGGLLGAVAGGILDFANAASSTRDSGWRRTSYAYILLQAKGPEVDRVPPLKIDLDFNDVTGYVVLPVTSPVVPIDASSDADERPYADLSVTQILDERRADEGVLGLEVKAQAKGLIPDLESIVDIDPADFEVTKIEPQDVSIERFADDEDSIESERLWLLELKAKEGVGEAKTFAFADPKGEDVVEVYQRYDDADLAEATPVVDLRERYDGGSKLAWWWWLAIAAAVGLVSWIAWRLAHIGDDDTPEESGPRLPQDLTPVTVLGLLQELRQGGGLGETDRRELDVAAIQIEQHYFGQANGEAAPDLAAIARRFAGRVPAHR